MKVFKRNAVIITVLLFVCVAVYLNWSYNRGQDLSVDKEVAENVEEKKSDSGDENKADDKSAEGTSKEESADSLYYEEDDSTSASSDYFDAARLSRQKARDNATSTLQEAAAVAGASQEEIDNAVSSIAVMANYSVQESKIENNLLAKDFDECVVFISEGAVNIYVPAPEDGLSEVSVGQITDTVLAEIDVSAEQIKITEIN